VLRAVLDANVYVSAALQPDGPPGQILRQFLSNTAFELIVSPAIAEEVIRALGYPKVRKLIRPGIEVERWFEDIVVLADMVAGTREFSGICEDPDDDKYVAAALEGRAACVVTGDQDLLALREYEGVSIVTPRTFLELLDVENRG
jgi:hypothetical protein